MVLYEKVLTGRKVCGSLYVVRCEQVLFEVNTLIRHLQTTHGSPVDRVLDFFKEMSKV